MVRFHLFGMNTMEYPYLIKENSWESRHNDEILFIKEISGLPLPGKLTILS